MAWMSISRQNISASAFRLAGPLAAALILGSVPAGAEAPAASESAPLLLDRLAGSWEGTVLYRNSLTGEAQSAATTMVGTRKGDSVVLDMEADDGKGRIVRQPFTITVQSARRTLTRNPGDRPITFAVTGNLAPKPSEPVALELVGRGSEGAGPVDLRETLTIDGPKLVWKRESRLDGKPYSFRSEYRLTRKP
jgi:hypothetical protein